MDLMHRIAQLRSIIAADPVRMRVLHQVKELGLPDCWVAAGFVRSAVWDYLHQRADFTPLPDIDVIWFEARAAGRASDAGIEACLRYSDGSLDWSVKNLARMHLRNGDQPYKSAADAMSHWPETATAVGVRLGMGDEIEVAAPLGLDDLFNLIVRPTARFQSEKRQNYLNRIASKKWIETWPRLTIL